MPNYCENDLTIDGPADEVHRILQEIKGQYEDGSGVRDFDFNTLIPYPTHFAELDRISYEWEEAHKAPSSDWKDRPRDGYNQGGYEWCADNWGTKWNAIRVRDFKEEESYPEGCIEASFTFDTAWVPPIPVIRALAEKYPKVSVEVRYFEQGQQLNGVLRIPSAEEREDGEDEWEESGKYYGTRGG